MPGKEEKLTPHEAVRQAVADAIGEDGGRATLPPPPPQPDAPADSQPTGELESKAGPNEE